MQSYENTNALLLLSACKKSQTCPYNTTPYCKWFFHLTMIYKLPNEFLGQGFWFIIFKLMKWLTSDEHTLSCLGPFFFDLWNWKCHEPVHFSVSLANNHQSWTRQSFEDELLYSAYLLNQRNHQDRHNHSVCLKLTLQITKIQIIIFSFLFWPLHPSENSLTVETPSNLQLKSCWHTALANSFSAHRNAIYLVLRRLWNSIFSFRYTLSCIRIK